MKTSKLVAGLAVSTLWACQSALDLDDYTFSALGGSGPGGSGSNGEPPIGAAGSGVPSSGGASGGANGDGDMGTANGASAGTLGAEAMDGAPGPAAVFDHYSFTRGSPTLDVSAEAGLLANDVGDGLAVVAGSVRTARGGSVALGADGSFSYAPPAPAFWGDDSFEYELAGDIEARRAPVRLSVQPGAVTLADVEAGTGNGFLIEGAAAQDFMGAAVSGAGDFNDDGFADLLVGAYGADSLASGSAGAGYLIFGRTSSSPLSLAALDAGVGFVAEGAAAGDLAGNAVSRAGDVNGDGLPDVLIGAYRSTGAAGANVGSAYVVFGKRDAGAVSLGALGAAGFAIAGIGTSEFAGTSVAGAGDVNGDGLDDLIVGVPGRTLPGITDAGAAYVIFGKRDTVTLSLVAIEAGGGGFAITGSAASDAAGSSVAGAGDVNGDGLDDIALGAPGRLASDSAVYVVFGKADGASVSLASLDAGSGGFVVGSPPTSLDVSRAVAGAGDVNGDGLDDVVVGGLAAYVVFGKADTAAVAIAQLEAGQGGFAIGDELVANSVAGAEDVNGDGLDDIVLGIPSAVPGIGGRSFGKTCVVFGARTPAPVLLSELAPGAGFCSFGVATENYFGQSVAGAGDVDRDGLADIVSGAYQASPQGRGLAGSAYVLFGWDATDALGARHVPLVGGRADDVFEWSADSIVSVQGGGGVDTLRLPSGQATLDATSLVPRLASIEVIDLANDAPSTLLLDDRSVRRLPRTRPGLPGGLVKTLIVLGDAGDQVRFDASDYEAAGNIAEHSLYRKRGALYGLELAAGVELVPP